MTTRGSGLIRLGNMTSYGEWRILEGQLEISFDLRSASREHQNMLTRYQAYPDALQIQLPDGSDPSIVRIIGYERRLREAIFYISQEKVTVRAPLLKLPELLKT